MYSICTKYTAKIFILYNSISEITNAQNKKKKKLTFSTSKSDDESAEDTLCITGNIY